MPSGDAAAASYNDSKSGQILPVGPSTQSPLVIGGGGGEGDAEGGGEGDAEGGEGGVRDDILLQIIPQIITP